MHIYSSKFYDFIVLYNLMLINLSKKKRKYKISLYYLDDKFNIKICDIKANELVFNFSFNCNEEDYFYLINIFENDFIENHSINLSMFKNLNYNDDNLSENLNINEENKFNFDNIKIHILKDNFFELNLYYFNGLNKVNYIIEDKEKSNQKTLIK